MALPRDLRIRLLAALDSNFPEVRNDAIVVDDPGRIGLEPETDLFQSTFSNRTWKEVLPTELSRLVFDLPLLESVAFERSVAAYLKAFLLGQIDSEYGLIYYLKRCIAPPAEDEGLLYPEWWAGLRPKQKFLIGAILMCHSGPEMDAKTEAILLVWIQEMLDLV